MKIYRGSATPAHDYVEAGRSRADDYYLAEGPGVAERFVATPTAGLRHLDSLSGDDYEAWVAGYDPVTGVAKGRLRHDDQAVRFVEVIVNGPKSWSLAAALNPEIAAAYDAAQDRAAEQIVGWLAEHVTTRVGPRGAQVQVPVQEIEAVTVRHHTSRAGDPHRHLHLQINARVAAENGWRGLHTVGVRDYLDAINGIGHAAVMTDPQFRAALADGGFTLDPASGEIDELTRFVGPFSARAEQIGRNIQRYEAQWRESNPGQEPGPGVQRAWDARAWADARPDKIYPLDGAKLTQHWVDELRQLGYREAHRSAPQQATPVGALDRKAAVRTVLSRLAARRSAWNPADVRGEVEQLLARSGIVADGAVRRELAEDLTARTLAGCLPLLDRVGVPEHVRTLTSPRVLNVEADLTARLAARATTLDPSHTDPAVPSTLDPGQEHAVAVLAGHHGLVVIEGAAGAGKTTTLAAARTALEQQGHRLIVVTPTLKAARIAAEQLGTAAGSAAWLAYQHGYRWDDDGTWTRLQPDTDPRTGAVFPQPSPSASLRPGDLLLVDEAGMLDQDTARAVLTIADEHHVRIAFMGDRHQLPAVGRGGVLDLAARWATPDATVVLDTVHRFTDPEYAQLSLAMRTGEDPGSVFDALQARSKIRVYPDEATRTRAMADEAVAAITFGRGIVVTADTRDQAARLNAVIHDHLVAARQVDDTHAATNRTGQRLGVGDLVTTRRNDRDLNVANRDSWTLTATHPDGSVTVTSPRGDRELPSDYVRQHLELGYASTVHAAQGDTTDSAHLLLGQHTSAPAAYVGMTRGRNANTAHLVAGSTNEAREQWIATFDRDRADLGPAHAATLAAAEATRYATGRPFDQVLVELEYAWAVEAGYIGYLERAIERRDSLRELVPIKAEHDIVMPPIEAEFDRTSAARADAQARLDALTAAITAHADDGVEALRRQWDAQRPAAQAAAETVFAGTGRFGLRRAAVREAREELTDWADTWRPIVPALPTDPGQLVQTARWFDDGLGLHKAFTDHARRDAQQAHPELQWAGATVQHIYKVFHSILQSAMLDGRLARNPAVGIKLPRAKGKEKRFLTHEQVAALADAAGDDRLAIEVLAYCGLRFGELAALRVRDIDLLRRRLRIEQSATEVDGIMVFGTPKSHQQRLVPIRPSLLDALSLVCKGKSPNDLVFTAPLGGVIFLRNWRKRVFDPAAEAAGLTPLSPHELRHTSASLAVAAGANVKAVQRMLGHASAAMTLDTYSGLFEDDLDDVAARLDAAATRSTTKDDRGLAR